MKLCPCGCRRPVLRERATYYSAKCRANASKARNSPVLTAKQCRTLRSAEWWLRDYREFLLPVIGEGDMSEETNAAIKKQCETLQALATEVGRIARGHGQLPLRLPKPDRAVRAGRGDEITMGVGR